MRGAVIAATNFERSFDRRWKTVRTRNKSFGGVNGKNFVVSVVAKKSANKYLRQCYRFNRLLFYRLFDKLNYNVYNKKGERCR